MMTGRDGRVNDKVATILMNGEGCDGEGDAFGSTTIKLGRDHVGFAAYVYVALMVLFGSTTAAFAKIVVREVPVTLVPAVRFGLVVICLLPWVFRRGVLIRMVRHDGPLLLLTAALCVPINQGFFLSAARLGPTSHVGFFYATCPLVVLVFAWAMRMERPDRGRIFGVLASVAGIGVIALGNLWSGHTATNEQARAVVLADLLLVGAVLSWGGYIAVSKPLIERHGAMPALAATCLVGCLLSVPIAIWAWPGWSRIGEVSLSAWVTLGVLAVFITPFSWAFQNLSLRRFDASQVATFSNASPALTVIWGMWLFDELVTPPLVIGGVLALGGIYWTCRPRPLAPRRFHLKPAMLRAGLDEPLAGG
jgi:drug/metabolite transporter (DMT)-like permease